VNASKLLLALVDAGLCTAELTSADEILQNEITVFNDFVRIDVQTFTPGITFEEAWEQKVIMHFQAQEFYVLSKEHLIASNKAAGRAIDLQDVDALRAQPS